MKIFLHEIGESESALDFTQEDSWVVESVRRVDEQDPGPAIPKPVSIVKTRPIQAHFSLRNVDDVIVISGKIRTHIQLLCSRCALPFQFPVNQNFSGLFCRDPVMAGVAHLERNHGEETKRVGKNQGHARHAHDFGDDSEGKDLDITYLSQEFIDLGDVLTEQLRLQIPFQPLCKSDCKGMCTQCGADLNQGRCACAKVLKVKPFAALGDMKN